MLTALASFTTVYSVFPRSSFVSPGVYFRVCPVLGLWTWNGKVKPVGWSLGTKD